MQVVSQLELQLQKERDRLQAMMLHLHMSKQQSVAAEQEKESSNVIHFCNNYSVIIMYLQLSAVLPHLLCF